MGSSNNQGLNNGYSGLGQGYNNFQNERQSGLGQGYNNFQNQRPGLGQGTNQYSGQTYGNNGYSGLGQGQNYRNNGQMYPSQSNSDSDLLNARAEAYSNSDDGYDRTTGLNSKPLNQQQGGYYSREKRNLGQETEPKGLGQEQKVEISSDVGLGQEIKPAGLGQSIAVTQAPPVLGQSVETTQLPTLGQSFETTAQVGLGQAIQATLSSGLGQAVEATVSTGGSLSGSLRKKRYIENEPYRKSCNTYYGKYICYRLYDADAQIPNEFTCWKTYVGKKNCTEAENILYLNRRNVEIDPAEQLDRQFYPNDNNDRRGHSEISSRGRYYQRDDEFGAVEQNLHNKHRNDRRLPNDEDRLRSNL